MRNSRPGSQQEDFQLFFCISFPQPGAVLCSACETATKVKEEILLSQCGLFPSRKGLGLLLLLQRGSRWTIHTILGSANKITVQGTMIEN